VQKAALKKETFRLQFKPQATPGAANSNVLSPAKTGGELERLGSSVALLQEELSYQTRHLEKTRSNMAELDIIMRRVEWRLHGFLRSMANINIKGLRRKSLRLAAIAWQAEKLG